MWYNVYVEVVVKGDWPDNYLSTRVARCITRKCIDVVAFMDGMYWVIEVKPIAIGNCFSFSIMRCSGDCNMSISK